MKSETIDHEKLINANIEQSNDEKACLNKYYDNLHKYYNSVEHLMNVSFDEYCKKYNL